MKRTLLLASLVIFAGYATPVQSAEDKHQKCISDCSDARGDLKRKLAREGKDEKTVIVPEGKKFYDQCTKKC